MSFLNHPLTERMLFTIVVIGILLGLYGLVRIVDISLKLNDNLAQKVQSSGEELELQSSAEGQSLMVADIQRRRMVQERGQMMLLAGIGVVLLGIGWLGYDFRNSSLKKQGTTVAEASETG